MTELGDPEQSIATVGRHAHENLRLIEDRDLEAVVANVTPHFVNHRSAEEPMAARVSGPEGMAATVVMVESRLRRYPL